MVKVNERSEFKERLEPTVSCKAEPPGLFVCETRNDTNKIHFLDVVE